MSTPEVQAAGGLVVHAGRLLVVHRPRYDDWSLPKGKLDPGETFEEAALREVHEEAGVRARLGAELPPTRYHDHKGRPKIVRYWVMEPESDPPPFAPNDEVDELRWLTPAEAAGLLSYAHDRELVAAWADSDDADADPATGTEIERKFLVARIPPDAEDAPSRRIVQGYLTDGGDLEVRVRRDGDAHVLTLKAGAGLERAEEELSIDPARFDRLWPLTEGRRIEKTRYRIAHGERTIELDVFAGPREGLIVAEVEFPSADLAAAWTGPDWLGEDVTEDPGYRNAVLAS